MHGLNKVVDSWTLLHVLPESSFKLNDIPLLVNHVINNRKNCELVDYFQFFTMCQLWETFIFKWVSYLILCIVVEYPPMTQGLVTDFFCTLESLTFCRVTDWLKNWNTLLNHWSTMGSVTISIARYLIMIKMFTQKYHNMLLNKYLIHSGSSLFQLCFIANLLHLFLLTNPSHIVSAVSQVYCCLYALWSSGLFASNLNM